MDAQEGALIASRLEAHGIKAEIRGQTASIGFGDLPSAVLAVEVWVPKDRLEDALAVVKDHLEERRAGDTDQADGEWTCPECGELSSEEFDLCWSCQTTRPGMPG